MTGIDGGIGQPTCFLLRQIGISQFGQNLSARHYDLLQSNSIKWAISGSLTCELLRLPHNGILKLLGRVSKHNRNIIDLFKERATAWESESCRAGK